MYNDTLLFEENADGTAKMLVRDYLKRQREALGMTQQEVADQAGIQMRQYQRLESGERAMSSASMRIGLAVCDVLKLDPHRFVAREKPAK